MDIIYPILQIILLFIIFALATAYFIKPAHYKIEFIGLPSFTRLNTPRKYWDDKRRTIELPNGDLYTIPKQATGHFVLLYDWAVKCSKGGNVADYIIPKGTPTDFASIPRVAHSLISPISNSIYGAVLHDYLYRNPSNSTASDVTKPEADALFYWSMRACGVSKLLAGLMYLAVLIFGCSSYKRP